MTKKRRSPQGEDSDGDDSDGDTSMEEENERMDEDEESTEDTPPSSEDDTRKSETLPFLDTFYSLSSVDATERSRAALALLSHCFFTSDKVNAKDAAYALKRLFNGLCSGRAAARQGYASALTSFLKISFSNGSFATIQKESQSQSGKEQDQEEKSPLQFLRSQLLKATDANQAESGKFGKRKKGSEERDYCFGRIFGIMSIQRSGILATSVGHDDDAQDVVAGFANDLVDLYRYKKWMREPAAQGIVTLLDSFRRKKDEKKTQALMDHVVKEVVVPKMLLPQDSENSNDNVDKRAALIQSYSPEQLAVAIYIQSSGDSAPFPLDEPILSSDNMPDVAEALCSTSHVVHPRTHLVWEVIWSYLTKPSTDQPRKRILVEKCPLGNQSAGETLTELFQVVILQSLLGEAEKPSKQSTTTHERRALALTLVKILVGGTYTSCITGPSAIDLDNELLEKVVLSPPVVQRLFLDVVCAGVGKAKQGSNQHMLKPLANHVLESMEESNDVEGDDLKRRLSLAKALLMCEPRFDGRTKTKTVSNLLFLDSAEKASSAKEVQTMWVEYVDFLESRILSLPAQSEPENSDEEEQESLVRSRSYEALGYVDLLFNVAKQILRMSSSSDKEADVDAFEEFKANLTQRVLGFLLASAFFDCSAVESKDEASGANKKKKKGKKKVNTNKDAIHPATLAGVRIREVLASCSSSPAVPYPVRLTLSSRYFSLLADCTAMAGPLKDKGADLKDTSKTSKDAKILDILVQQCQGWINIEENGAVCHQTSNGEEQVSSKELVIEFQSLAHQTRKCEDGDEDGDQKAKAKEKCASGAALLASILYLHRLHCGKPENVYDDPDADDDDDNDAEIDELISDLSEVTNSLLEQNESEGNSEDEGNPLLGLAELCITILSSPFGSGTQSRGASSKIVRDAVKYAWIGGLNAAAHHSSMTENSSLLDNDVMNLILSGMGVEGDEEDGEDYEEMEEEQSEDDMQSENDNHDEDDSSEDNEGVFNAAAAEALDAEDEDVDMEDNDKQSIEDDKEKDLELDSNALQSLLLEDSDADLSEDDEGELEHHAGADAALAQLIKLKKDARKAGLQAKERLELTNQLRCVILLETLVVGGPTSSYSKALRSEVILKTLVPLLRARMSLEKSLAAAQDIGKKAAVCVSEKRALLERMTSVLKTKICKMRLNSVQWSETINVAEYASELASKILNEARKTDDSNQSSCCSTALLMTFRSISKPEDRVAAASVYSEAVKEWSTKRTTRLGSSLFEDLVHQAQSLAQATLAAPIALATVDARSPFLKSEAFRLLGGLYGTATKNTYEHVDGIEKLGLDSLLMAAPAVAKGVAKSMETDDMKKTKRIREILKSAEKLVAFATKHSVSDAVFWETIESLPLDAFANETESHGVKNACDKLSVEIKAALETAAAKKQMEIDEPKETVTPKSSAKKKKKKKKGKKK